MHHSKSVVIYMMVLAVLVGVTIVIVTYIAPGMKVQPVTIDQNAKETLVAQMLATIESRPSISLSEKEDSITSMNARLHINK